MQTAHEIVASFIASKTVDMYDFRRWFQEGGYSQCEANVYDTSYLNVLEQYVEERGAEHAATLPRKPMPNNGILAGPQNFLRSRCSYRLSRKAV